MRYDAHRTFEQGNDRLVASLLDRELRAQRGYAVAVGRDDKGMCLVLGDGEQRPSAIERDCANGADQNGCGRTRVEQHGGAVRQRDRFCLICRGIGLPRRGRLARRVAGQGGCQRQSDRRDQRSGKRAADDPASRHGRTNWRFCCLAQCRDRRVVCRLAEQRIQLADLRPSLLGGGITLDPRIERGALLRRHHGRVAARIPGGRRVGGVSCRLVGHQPIAAARMRMALMICFSTALTDMPM